MHQIFCINLNLLFAEYRTVIARGKTQPERHCSMCNASNNGVCPGIKHGPVTEAVHTVDNSSKP